MTQSPIARQVDLPKSIQLFRHAPNRDCFPWKQWDPTKVRVAADLPPYLILGDLDPTSFTKSAEGWSAMWQGSESDTHFDVEYQATEHRYQLRQTWQGLDGGYSICPARIPLDKLIFETLYVQFPSNWDHAAKQGLEERFQVTVVAQPKDAYSFCGMPDGAFRTIAFPVAIKNLRLVRDWLGQVVAKSRLPYPVSAEAKLLFQAINYLEGKAPDWTATQVLLFNNSLEETGIASAGFPVKETANDGSAAWTLRREVYVLFIGLPFAGLADFLERMATTNGPIRLRNDPQLRIELQPVVMPAAFELMTRSMTFWDKERTTRCFWQFAEEGKAASIPTAPEVVEGDANADVLLRKAETISADVVATIAAVMQQGTDGGQA